MKFKNIVFLFLFFVSVISSALEPRQVPKTGDVDVPPGMHLVVDRTGARWLLPEDMDDPPEREVKIVYFKANKTPSVIGTIGDHQILDGPISALDAVVSSNETDPQNLMQRIPSTLADVMRLEKYANLHAAQSPDLQSLGVFGPAQSTTFKLPYIPMPAEEFEFAAVSSYASEQTKRLVSFEMNGKQYYRFFIHPNYVGSYAELINKFGIVYHYEAISSSSPRSLVVMDPDNSKEVDWIKVSLHKQIDGSVRINTDRKARRAILMSEAIQRIGKQVLAKYGLSFMLEPAAFQPKGKISSTIHREVDPDFLVSNPNIRWVPAFILQNTGEDAVPGLNIDDMIRASGLSAGDFVREKLVRPLLKAYLSMGLLEGLPGELHTQNFYYKLQKTSKGWMPTGQVKFKDNDGFRYDTEMALRRGRPMDFFAAFSKPFFWGKFSNTLGLGAEGVPFLGSWYYKLIRNVNGFETLAAYVMRALQTIDNSGNWSKETVQLMFDDVAAEEAKKITGIGLERSDYGYGFMQGLNKVLNIWRAKLSMAAPTDQRLDERLQEYLRGEWDRLRVAERVSTLRRAVPRDYYVIVHETPDHQFMLEARTPRTTLNNPDPTVGFAIVETADTPEGQAFRSAIQPNLSKVIRNSPTEIKSGGTMCSAAYGG